jgi:hypothetical protein
MTFRNCGHGGPASGALTRPRAKNTCAELICVEAEPEDSPEQLSGREIASMPRPTDRGCRVPKWMPWVGLKGEGEATGTLCY